MHERCAKLTLGMCPGIGAQRDRDNVVVVRALARHVEVRYLHSDDQADREPEHGVEVSDSEENGADPHLMVDGAYATPLTPAAFRGH
jgi:hypothetical protein